MSKAEPVGYRIERDPETGGLRFVAIDENEARPQRRVEPVTMMPARSDTDQGDVMGKIDEALNDDGIVERIRRALGR